MVLNIIKRALFLFHYGISVKQKLLLKHKKEQEKMQNCALMFCFMTMILSKEIIVLRIKWHINFTSLAIRIVQYSLCFLNFGTDVNKNFLITHKILKRQNAKSCNNDLLYDYEHLKCKLVSPSLLGYKFLFFNYMHCSICFIRFSFWDWYKTEIIIKT